MSWDAGFQVLAAVTAQLGPAAIPEELFDRILQMADNAGAIDADRAVNYCGLHHPAIYAKAAESFCRLQVNRRLAHFEVRFLQLNRRPTPLFAAKS